MSKIIVKHWKDRHLSFWNFSAWRQFVRTVFFFGSFVYKSNVYYPNRIVLPGKLFDAHSLCVNDLTIASFIAISRWLYPISSEPFGAFFYHLILCYIFCWCTCVFHIISIDGFLLLSIFSFSSIHRHNFWPNGNRCTTLALQRLAFPKVKLFSSTSSLSFRYFSETGERQW